MLSIANTKSSGCMTVFPQSGRALSPKAPPFGLLGKAAPPKTEALRKTLSALGLFMWLGLASALAQSYSIDWWTVDGGGGTSTGGVYMVSGTIGQPDAGVMSGGNFTVQGGFWPGIIVPSTGETPTLFIQRSGDSVTISWSPAPAGFELEATTDLVGAVWTAAPAGNPVTIPSTGPARYYRLRKP